MTDIRKAVARAMKYVVVVKAGDFLSNDTFCIVEGPDCVVQVGGDFADDHKANEECGKLNIDAAIAAHIDAIMVPKLKGLSDDFYFVLNDACDNRDYQAVWQSILTAMRNEK